MYFRALCFSCSRSVVGLDVTLFFTVDTAILFTSQISGGLMGTD